MLQGELISTKDSRAHASLGDLVITADSKFEDVQKVFGRSGLGSVHNQGLGVASPFARTLIHAYQGVAFEVMRNGYLASVTLFSQ